MSSRPLPPELDPRRSTSRRPGRSGGSRPPTSGSGGGSLITKLAALTSALVLAVSLGGYAMATHYDGKIDRITISGLNSRPTASAAAQNFLLVGSDNREGLSPEEIADLHVGAATAENGDGRRSDTMILMHLSGGGGKALFVSLPRDSYVRIPAYTDARGKEHGESRNKLNAAYALGGPDLAVRTVSENTGVQIDHYVEIGFDGFVRMVDALDGIDVCAPRKLVDKKSGLNLPAGTSRLDGAQALAYVRARSVDSTADLGRMKRQQSFLGAMFRRATSGGVLLNPLKLNAFLDSVLQSVKTDSKLTRQDIFDLATRTDGLSPSSIEFTTVPLSDVDYRPTPSIGSTVRWDEQKATVLFQAIRDDRTGQASGTTAQPSPGTVEADAPTVPPSSISVKVLNGAGVRGLGARAATDLEKVGFVLAGPAGNASRLGTTQTEVRYDPRWNQSLKTVLAALPGAKAVAVPGQGKVFTITVGTSYTAAKQVTLVAAPSASSSGSPSASATSSVKTTSAADNPCD